MDRGQFTSSNSDVFYQSVVECLSENVYCINTEICHIFLNWALKSESIWYSSRNNEILCSNFMTPLTNHMYIFIWHAVSWNKFNQIHKNLVLWKSLIFNYKPGVRYNFVRHLQNVASHAGINEVVSSRQNCQHDNTSLFSSNVDRCPEKSESEIIIFWKPIHYNFIYNINK